MPVAARSYGSGKIAMFHRSSVSSASPVKASEFVVVRVQAACHAMLPGGLLQPQVAPPRSTGHVVVEDRIPCATAVVGERNELAADVLRRNCVALCTRVDQMSHSVL